MLNSAEITQSLDRLGFYVKAASEKIHSVHRDDIEYLFYIKRPEVNSKSGVVKKAPLVVHPDYLERIHAAKGYLYGIDPVTEDFFHSSNLKGFPTRIRTGKKPIQYGIAVNIEDEEALSRFVEWLGSPSDQVMPVASALDDIANAEAEFETASDTEKESIVKSRLGQGKFRDNLLNYWSECAVSGVTLPAFLRASHIKPWRDCTNAERLDTYNGLLLNTTLDAAFDRGFISFADDGRILISATLKDHAAELSISEQMSLKSVNELHRKYLDWHRRHVFDSENYQAASEAE
ncbi:HNH endonuclease [Parahaliea sp. F7430]|uniref:HNH endonuclease n=1 Tax=Sediminihaliea albiluteola TaxID=2758564 RepID=A0A7W2TTQ2_9GAMM|nr:HNH endonuclease [Sediminihaliea albiluteola]MBA6411767.1 HNH endonuclease [Sediminihaliea albiluteola]